MRKVLSIIMALLFVLSLSCNIYAETADKEHGPDEVASLFFESMGAGDMETMLTIIQAEKAEKIAKTLETLTPDQDMTKLDNLTTGCFTAEQVKAGAMKCTFSDIKTEIKEHTDAAATVVITFTAVTEMGDQKSTDKSSNTVTLVKEETGWVIEDIVEILK